MDGKYKRINYLKTYKCSPVSDINEFNFHQKETQSWLKDLLNKIVEAKKTVL